MSDTLYIIGNGFDLHHRMKTAYSDFGKFLKVIDQDTYALVAEYLAGGEIEPSDQFWSEFEAALGNLDRVAVEDFAQNFLASYSADDWSDAYHHDYQYEISLIAKGLSHTLRDHFSNWVASIDLPATPCLQIDAGALYLSFNYTKVLQQTYGVADGQVLHIHGAVGGSVSDIVLGHAYEPEPVDPYRQYNDPADADTRVVEGVEILDGYFQETAKPTGKIIHDNAAFWARLTDIQTVRVLGHSLAEVDVPYLAHIDSLVRESSCDWIFSYYGDKAAVEKRVNDLGLMARSVIVCEMEEAAKA